MLRIFRTNLSGASTLQPRGKKNKTFTDQGATQMMRAMLIELDGPLFFIFQRVSDGHG